MVSTRLPALPGHLRHHIPLAFGDCRRLGERTRPAGRRRFPHSGRALSSSADRSPVRGGRQRGHQRSPRTAQRVAELPGATLSGLREAAPARHEGLKGFGVVGRSEPPEPIARRVTNLVDLGSGEASRTPNCPSLQRCPGEAMKSSPTVDQRAADNPRRGHDREVLPCREDGSARLGPLLQHREQAVADRRPSPNGVSGTRRAIWIFHRSDSERRQHRP